MEIATVIGLIVAWGGLLVGIILEGAPLNAFIGVSAFLIVFFGTWGATLASFSWKQFSKIIPITKQAFIKKEMDAAGIINTLVGFAERARREGLLVLEDEAAKVEDKFLQKGIQLVVDGTDMELVRSILETELSFLEQRHKVGENIYMTAGGFSPTLGIVGTVMGLVFALLKLAGEMDPGAVAHAIGVAFIATLYGIAFANLIYIPIAQKLKQKSEEEILLREVMIEGILSIQAGDNPRIVEEKLKAFLPPYLREQVRAKRERGAVVAGTGAPAASPGAR